MFRRKPSTLFSSEAQLAAEDRLRTFASDLSEPTVGTDALGAAAYRPDDRGRMIGRDQIAGLASIAASGRVLDVLVGPAGAGKTTAMRALRRTWGYEHGRLAAIDAFGMLVAACDDAPELVDVHRFIHAWEKGASLDLRHGRLAAIDAYELHGRIVGGDADARSDAAYAAWRRDRESGLASVLVADSGDAVMILNRRARADLVLDGIVDASAELALHDGTAVSVGDVVMTRKNDRRLWVGADWGRHGMRWTVTGLRRDRSLVIRRPEHLRGGSVVLPAAYVAAHLELGYAVTAYRAQGTTTDAAHALFEPTTTRENFYVAMTRGRAANNVYVALNRPDDEHDGSHPGGQRGGNRPLAAGWSALSCGCGAVGDRNDRPTRRRVRHHRRRNST